jgi:hypothetical protein
MLRASVRRARKPRRCDDVPHADGCTGTIQSGERYAIAVASPQHDDYGNERWLRMVCCLPCARRYPITWPPDLLASPDKGEDGEVA